MSKKQSPKKVAGVALEPEVIEYLDQLAEKEERSRSWILNLNSFNIDNSKQIFNIKPSKTT